MSAKRLNYPKRDLKDKVFNRLTVISFSHYQEDSSGRRFDIWNCLCSCGNTHQTRGNCLITAHVKSCGCLLKKHYEKLKSDSNFKNTKAKGEAAFNDLYSSYKYRAKNKGYSFELTKDEFKTLISNNCFWCDIPPYKEIRKKYNGTIKFNGIDRLNSNEGYTIQNSVSCCEICNKAKRDLSLEEFEEWLWRISNYTLREI